MRTPHEQILELVSGYGEIWSATMIAAVMTQQKLPFIFLNARDVLIVSEGELGTKVHWEESETKLNEYLLKIDSEYFLKNNTYPNFVITGKIRYILTLSYPNFVRNILLV